MSRYRTLLLIGAPGAGKGTMGKALGAIPGFHHLACGDVFRNLDMTTALGRIFVEYSSKGLLVPDDATVKLWKVTVDALVASHRYRPASDLLVLDGIPRNVEQARFLEEHVEVERVIHLVCTDEERMIERLQRRALKEQRFDDASDEVIRRRWKVYEAESEPVLAFYPSDKIETVDALGSPVQVLHDILGRLLARGTASSAN
ncbi:MAG: adenylate kinase family protein [Armatimonadota bacterium]